MRISDWSSDVCSSDLLTDFSFVPERGGLPVANRVEPGKRPRSAMSPTIVLGPDGKAILALGSAGGPRIIMHVMKTLVGVLDWGLPVDQAIALPKIGRASCWERVCQYVSISVVGVSLKKKLNPKDQQQ